MTRTVLLAGSLALACGPEGASPRRAAVAPAADSSPAPADPGAGCAAEPLGEVRVFLDPGRAAAGGAGKMSAPAPAAPSVVFEAVVASIAPPDGGGFVTVALRDEARNLRFHSPLGPPPLRLGERYRLRVDYEPGYPPASALLVWDSEGLLYAAASDERPGATVLKDGVPGFALRLLPATCDSRPHDRCFEALRNAPLEAAFGGRSVTLHNGGVADLGAYRVTCLTAQAIAYSSRCQDAGRIALSYVIERRGPNERRASPGAATSSAPSGRRPGS